MRKIKKLTYVSIHRGRASRTRAKEELEKFYIEDANRDRVTSFVKRKIQSQGLSLFLEGPRTCIEIRPMNTNGTWAKARANFLSFLGLSPLETRNLLIKSMTKVRRTRSLGLRLRL